MPTDPEPSSPRGGRPSKVQQLIDEYDLSDLARELERRFTAPDDQRDSLRELAAYANRRALDKVMTGAGQSPLDGEVENTYRLLTSDDVSEGTRAQAERRLERTGIDVDALREDFASYGAVRRFLRNYRDVEYGTDEGDDPGVNTESLQRLVGRTEAIARYNVERLRDSGQVAIGSFTVSAPVRVFCTDCDTRFEFGELVADGSCNCTSGARSNPG